MKPDALLATAILGLATLTELNAVVTITRQPTNQWVSLDAHVTNKVTVSSTAPPITYQWHGPAGQLLTGETNRTSVTLELVLPSIQTNQAGGYYVALSDTNNVSVQSDTATITVDPAFIKLTEGELVTELGASQGARWWDPDGDGWLDLLVSHAAPIGPGVLPSFFRNNRDGTFSKDTSHPIALVLKRSIVTVAGDFDNDGDEDLYYSGNAHAGSTEPMCDLFRNDGNGRFTLVSGPWQQDRDLTIDCTFVDYDQDGLLDIYVVNGHKAPACLYRQISPGNFVKMTAAQVGSILGASPETYNASWADFDNDGDPDVWIHNDEGPNQIHRNDGRGVFTRATLGSIVQKTTGGWGLWGDFDNDGWFDLFSGGGGAGGPYTNALHRNLQGTNFVDVAATAGVALKMACWSAAWGDYDNDGWLDLFASRWSYAATTGTNLLFHNRGDGTFEPVEVGSPIRDGRSHAVVTWADYDNDGFLDLFVGCGEPGGLELDHLYRNNGPANGNANHWLKVKLNGQASNRSGIGAKIRVRATIGGKEVWQVREITGNGGSSGGPGLIAHFGLGDATKADLVRIEWPSGIAQTLTNVPAGQLGQPPLTITESQGYTGAAPAFAGASFAPTGFGLAVAEPTAGVVYILEGSTDLATWTKLMVRTSAGGTYEWVDEQASDPPTCFYRLVVP